MEEYSTALTIRYLSRRCYTFLRKTLKYPLPGVSTLRKWASTLKLRSGVLSDVLAIMKIHGNDKTPKEKVTVLTFDEMKVSRMFEYCKKEDEVVGPHNYAQAIMARGLFDKWKQPVFLDFDKPMSKKLLLKVISELEKINYKVVGVTSDCGGGNQKLWNELQVTLKKPYFLHPITKEKIFVFADAPHLLKLLRNWFLDTGFLINEKKLHKGPLLELINKNLTEISSLFKLAEIHVKCVKTKRQNVAIAAELFSHTVSSLGKGKKHNSCFSLRCRDAFSQPATQQVSRDTSILLSSSS